MPRTRNPYPTEFREQLVALARAVAVLKVLRGTMNPARQRSMTGSNRQVPMMLNAMTA